MSKAFLRESDYEQPPDVPTPASVLPAGAKNYLTPAGARRLRAELARLVEVERPALAAQTDDPEAKRDLKVLDHRARQLGESLRRAEIVEAVATPDDVIRFGATVTVRDAVGDDARYQLVGVDEADPDAGTISWLSPLAQALLNARAGDRVSFHTPSGMRELTILTVEPLRDEAPEPVTSRPV